MQTTLDKAEIAWRFALVLNRLCSPRYPIAISAEIETDDPARLDRYDGTTSAQCDFVIGDRDRWNGDLLVTVMLPDLHLEENFVFAISPLLHQHGDLVDLMGDALVWSH
jgi:hypothetical protein